MRVGIVGATGFVGRRLAGALLARGDAVTAFSRTPARARAVLPAVSDHRGLEQLTAGGCHGLDALINLAGEPVMGQRWDATFKARVRDSRVATTRAAVEALAAEGEAGPRVLVNASAVGYYGDRGDTMLTESAAAGGDFLAGVCVDWEAEAQKAAEKGAREVRLRIGVVLGEAGGALEKMLLPFRMGLGGPMGDGRQYLPWVHIDDVVGAALFALDRETLRGAVNVTAPQPLRWRDFAAALGRALHRPAVIPVPGFALKLALGEGATAVLSGQNAVPRALLDAGYTFRFDDVDGALRDVLGKA